MKIDRKTLLARTGNIIRMARESQGISQIDLAKKVGCSAPTIANIENGVNPPSIAMAGKIAAKLSCPVAVILLHEERDDTIKEQLLKRFGKFLCS